MKSFFYCAVVALLLLNNACSTAGHTAVLFGANGAVGSEVFQALLANNGFWKQVIVVGRRFPTHIDISAIEGVKVRQVKMKDLSKIASDERFMGADPVDACFNCIGLGNPHEHNLQHWYSTEVDLTETIAQLCGKQLQSKHVSLLSAVDADESAQPLDTQAPEFAKDAPPIGWWTMLTNYFQIKGLAEKALASVQNDNGLPFVRIFQPSSLVTPETRYGWLDWALFRIHPYVDPLLPQRYRSVPVRLLGMAMVADAQEVLLRVAKNSMEEPRVTRLVYEDYVRLAGVPHDILVQKEKAGQEKEL